MEALPSAGDGLHAHPGMATTRAKDDVSHVHGSSAAVSEPATLELVSGVVAALRSSDRAAALERLREEGIEATVSDGVLELQSRIDPELETVLTGLFALALDERALLPSGKHAAIGELAAEIAHEINNPLFAILGLNELLLKEAQPGTRAHERLLLVERTGLEIKELVRALLTFAREPADEIGAVSLHDVVAETLELVRHTSASKEVEIVERLEAAPVRVEGNRNQLKQVLLNLLTNARYVLPDGGTITVTLVADGDRATVRVSDTGPGVADALRERIFDAFFTTKGQRGTGLGLTVSRTIARLHGGRLDLADADEGEGAAFVLELPITTEEPA
jgi:signal transduction histidine kinase